MEMESQVCLGQRLLQLQLGAELTESTDGSQGPEHQSESDSDLDEGESSGEPRGPRSEREHNPQVGAVGRHGDSSLMGADTCVLDLQANLTGGGYGRAVGHELGAHETGTGSDLVRTRRVAQSSKRLRFADSVVVNMQSPTEGQQAQAGLGAPEGIDQDAVRVGARACEALSPPHRALSQGRLQTGGREGAKSGAPRGAQAGQPTAAGKQGQAPTAAAGTPSKRAPVEAAVRPAGTPVSQEGGRRRRAEARSPSPGADAANMRSPVYHTAGEQLEGDQSESPSGGPASEFHLYEADGVAMAGMYVKAVLDTVLVALPPRVVQDMVDVHNGFDTSVPDMSVVLEILRESDSVLDTLYKWRVPDARMALLVAAAKDLAMLYVDRVTGPGGASARVAAAAGLLTADGRATDLLANEIVRQAAAASKASPPSAAVRHASAGPAPSCGADSPGSRKRRSRSKKGDAPGSGSDGEFELATRDHRRASPGMPHAPPPPVPEAAAEVLRKAAERQAAAARAAELEAAAVAAAAAAAATAKALAMAELEAKRMGVQQLREQLLAAEREYAVVQGAMGDPAATAVVPPPVPAHAPAPAPAPGRGAAGELVLTCSPPADY